MQPGDLVRIETKEKIYDGILMPNSAKNVLFLKLGSGYNVGINVKSIKSKKVIKKGKKAVKRRQKRVVPKKGLKTVTILHSGGTIASAVDYETGAVIARFTPEDLLGMFPELKSIVNINSRLVGNMWSEDMRFAHYNILSKEVEKEVKKGVDGIIITHGTDTLHYTSAALAFALENLPIPVIIVGAQRSSDRGSSDAGMNLICAANFIANTDFAGVAVCMHGSVSDDCCLILPPTKVRKMHTSRRDAFKPINVKPIAKVDINGKVVFEKFIECSRVDKSRKLVLKPFNEKLKVGFVKAHPQMFASELDPYFKFNGLVLEGTGLGNMPFSVIDEHTKEHKRIKVKIKELANKIPVVMSSQTIFGRLQMNVYAKGRELQEAGVIGNYSDMTPETTFIKLAWLLSNYPKEVKELLLKDFRGEISKRDLPEGYII